MTIPVPGPVLDNLRKDRLLRGVCGFTAGDAAVDFGGRSAVVPALSMTGDCYQTLGVRPVIGRLLAPSDGQQQVFLLSTMSELRERSLLQDRLLAGIGKIYVFLVLVLVALGLVGLLLFFVSSREREIAIRVALGAERRDIKFLVAREAALLTGSGMLIGLPFSYGVIHGISSLVYGVSPTLIEPVLFSLLVLSAVAILAIVGPMYRASRIEPSGALRDG